MELDDIKSCWKAEDKRIAAHVKVNREASFKKLRSAFDKIRIWRLLQLIATCIVVPLILVMTVYPRLKNDGSMGYYLGLAAFIVPIIISFVLHIYRYIRLLKIDFTTSVLKAQKEIIWLEMFDKKRNLYSMLFVPVSFWGALRAFGIWNMHLRPEGILMLALIGVTMIVSCIVKMKVIIPREYSKIKSLLDEIEKEEKNNIQQTDGK